VQSHNTHHKNTIHHKYIKDIKCASYKGSDASNMSKLHYSKFLEQCSNYGHMSLLTSRYHSLTQDNVFNHIT